MKTTQTPDFSEIFGTLNKMAGYEKCLTARQQKDPLHCKPVKLGNLRICQTHNSLMAENK